MYTSATQIDNIGGKDIEKRIVVLKANSIRFQRAHYRSRDEARLEHNSDLEWPLIWGRAEARVGVIDNFRKIAKETKMSTYSPMRS